MDLISEFRRWLQSPAVRKSGLLVGITIMLTVVVTWFVQLSRELARERGTGTLLVTSKSTLMFAELVGDDVSRRFSVPTVMPIEAPTGDYRLHVGPPGQLSRAYNVTLSGDTHLTMRVTDDDRAMWRLDSPIDTFVSLDRADSSATDIVITDTGTLRRINGRTGQPVWTVDLASQQESLRETAPGFVWVKGQTGIVRRDRRWAAHVTLVATGDLNGDGRADVVVASHRQAWLLAVSGEDGSVLWLAARGASVVAPTEARRRNALQYELQSGIIGAPQLAGDLDGDGVADLVASMIDRRSRDATTQPGTLARWVEAVSGATGESLWRYEFAAADFALPPGTDPPDAFRWLYEHANSRVDSGHSSGSHNRYTRGRSYVLWSGSSEYQPGIPRLLSYQDASGAARNQVVVIGGRQLVTLDAVTGSADNNVLLKQPPGAAVRLADVNGDKIPEAIVVSEIAAPPNRAATTRTHIAVHSLTANKPLWSRAVLAEFPRPAIETVGVPEWPLIEDLDGDGRCEVILPGDAPPNSLQDRCWSTLEVLRGDTGKSLWKRQLFATDPQIDVFTTGPDIDGDGHREVFAATMWNRMMELHVDCLSGLDGHTLWREHRQIRLHQQDPQDFYLDRLTWWDAASDGWPQLIVPVADKHGRAPRSVTLFSAGTGNVTQVGRGITATHPIDVDRDGWDELITVSVNPRDQQSQLTCLAGIAADRRRWAVSENRQTDEQDRWFAVADFDRDGIVDLVRVRPDGWMHAVSGGTGTLLWKRRELKLRHHQSASIAQQTADHDDRELDLNGDHVPDVAIGISGRYNDTGPPLFVMSGRDGRRLWNGGPDGQHVQRGMTVVVRDLNGDGRGEVIMLAAVVAAQTRPRGGWPERQTVFVVDGRSGNVRWQQPLQATKNPGSTAVAASWLKAAIADFNDDGTLDLAVPAEAQSGATKFEIRGYDGANGSLLWTVPLQTQPSQRSFSDLVHVLACDANGDGKADLVVPDLITNRGGTPSLRLRMVNGADGSILWSQSTSGAAYRSHSYLKALRLLPLRDGARGPRICLNLATARDQLAIIDMLGNWQPTAPRNLPNRRSFDLALWACDADSDGADELLMIDGKTMSMVEIDDVAAPLWERRLDGGHEAFEELLSTDRTGHVAVIHDEAAGGFEGVNLLDGTTRWTCRLPSEFGRPSGARLDVLSNRRQPRQPPRILVASYWETLLRQAQATAPTSIAPTAAEQSAMRSPPTLVPSSDDARLARQLPWYFDIRSRHQSIPLGFAAWSGILCLTLIVLPATFVARMVRRRQWGLRTLLAAPGVVAIVLVCARMNAPAWAESDIGNNGLAGLAALPVLMLLYLLGRAALQRKWANVGAILGVLLTVAVGIAGLLLAGDLFSNKPLQTGEYYVLDGWYLIVFPAFYATGWLSVFFYVASYFARPKRDDAPLPQSS